MREYKLLTRTIYVIAFLLITEPLIKMALFKFHTGLPWDTVWSNIIENGHSFSRFFTFWVLSPLAGVLLLSFSTLSYIYYFFLSGLRIYLLLSFTPYSWPYFTEKPHVSSLLFEGVNFVLMLYLFYPYFQRFFLSRYLRNFFDMRGRVDCNMKAYLYIEHCLEPISCRIVNISSGGAKIEHPIGHQFEHGKILFKDFDGHPLCFDFRVVARFKENKSMGIEFEYLSPKDKLFLRTCIFEQTRQVTA